MSVESEQVCGLLYGLKRRTEEDGILGAEKLYFYRSRAAGYMRMACKHREQTE